MKSKKFLVFALCSLLFVQAKAQELLNYPLDTVRGVEVYRYAVDKGIGLYRIGVNFNISQSEILRMNPHLRERGVHYKEIIFIPTGRKIGAKQTATTSQSMIVETEPVVVQTTITETRAGGTRVVSDATSRPVVVESKPVAEEKPVVVESKPVVVEAKPAVEEKPVVIEQTPIVEPVVLATDSVFSGERRVIELALMLPFESQQTKRSSNAERMTEFYQGALLALRDLQSDSLLYRLRVYDTERSERRVNALVDSTELDHVRGVLGLVYPIQVERMAAWCDAHKVPLLLPFSDDSEVEANPQMLQFNSTDKQEADSLCEWIRNHNVHCVMVDVQDADLASSVRTLRKQMRSHAITYSSLALFDLVKDSARYALDDTRENLIILHSDRYQHIRILLPHLQKLQKAGYKIRIVSQYSWLKENIELPQIYTSVFTADGDRSAYETMWRQFFVGNHSTEAPRYDLLGYDLMQTLVSWLNGKREYIGLQSAIRWEKVGNGGWQNGNVQVVVK